MNWPSGSQRVPITSFGHDHRINGRNRMNRLDWKSTLIGFLLALSIFLGVGAAYQKKGEEPARKPGTPQVGRFRIVIGGDARGVSALVLDTATGQVWSDDHVPASGKPGKEFLAPKLEAEK
jgi:hypothetical protein